MREDLENEFNIIKDTLRDAETVPVDLSLRHSQDVVILRKQWFARLEIVRNEMRLQLQALRQKVLNWKSYLESTKTEWLKKRKAAPAIDWKLNKCDDLIKTIDAELERIKRIVQTIYE